jgi:hypothetical protein
MMTEDDKYLIQTRFCGFQLIAFDECFEDKVRVKTHKKKRIDKKWLKRYGYKRVPRNEFYIDKVNRNIYGHSKYINAVILEARMNNGVAKNVTFC